MNIDSLPGRNEDEQSILRTKRFEFVTLTEAPSKEVLKENSKKFRSQVMLDFVRKYNRQAMTGIVEEPKAIGMEEPALYKSRFKLDSQDERKVPKEVSCQACSSRHILCQWPFLCKRIINYTNEGHTEFLWRTGGIPGYIYNSLNRPGSI